MLKLFDFSKFHFPAAARWLFILSVVIAVAWGVTGFVGILGNAFMPLGQRLILAVMSLGGAALSIVAARFAFEFMLVIFSINENVKAIRDRQA